MFRLIAGPCVIESKENAMMIAEHLKEVTDKLGIPFTFKASFDKANRTSIKSYRGPGLEKGLQILSDIKEEVLTDGLKHREFQNHRDTAFLWQKQLPSDYTSNQYSQDTGQCKPYPGEKDLRGRHI